MDGTSNTVYVASIAVILPPPVLRLRHSTVARRLCYLAHRKVRTPDGTATADVTLLYHLYQANG